MNDDLAKRLLFENATEEERENYDFIDYETYDQSPYCTYNYNIYEDYKNKKFYKVYYRSDYDLGYSYTKVEEVEPVVTQKTMWKAV